MKNPHQRINAAAPGNRSGGRASIRPHRTGVLALVLAAGILPAGGTGLLPPSTARAEEAPSACHDPGPHAAVPAIRLKPLAKGLASPVAAARPGDGTGRLFIVEQAGTIRIWDGKRIEPEPFLDIRSRVVSGGEKGLLGLAFHPDYRTNGRFYVDYTSRAGGLHTVVSEFRMQSDPGRADRDSETVLLTIPQPYGNHNGGQLEFGPDGMLYIGMGDGGSGYDPHGHGQDLSSPLGKILRIDVDRRDEGRPYAIPPDNPFADRAGSAPEVWAYGLRNPWRFSFDGPTGRLYAGDVGQDTREEIDVIRKGGNYGWNVMEGSICTPGIESPCDPRRFVAPIWDYPRPEGTVVIGGYAYRGRSIPGLCGAYLYADFGNGRIFGLRYDGTAVTTHRKLLSTPFSISSFGRDDEGELYLLDLGGGLHKIVSARQY